MKKLKKIGIIFTLMVMLSGLANTMPQTMFGFKTNPTVVAYAAGDGESLSNAVDSIKNSSGAGIDSDDSIKNKISGTTKDIIDIILAIVLGVLLITGIWTGVQFANVGDNPQKKQQLKAILIGQIVGVIFLVNYFGLMKLVMKGSEVLK